MNSQIFGTGSYLPEKVVDNQTLVETGLETSDEWIVSHTGIRTRHLASPQQATSDLAVEAAKVALERAGVDARDLGYIVVATSSPDHQLPATANLVQTKLGASCGSIDLNAGCSGFVQAVAVGFAMFAQNPERPVLVIGADTYSRIMNWQDRKTAVFFGDGAGALLINVSKNGINTSSLLKSVISGSDGSGGCAIIMESGGSRTPVTQETLEARTHQLKMDGRAVWEFAVNTVPNLIKQVVDKAGWQMSEVDLIIPHQANAKMLGVIASDLGISRDVLFSNVETHANTAAASVAIALDEAVTAGRVQAGSKLVLVGFGAGLSWCAACLEWPAA